MVAGILHQVANIAGLRVSDQPLVIGPDHVACAVLSEADDGSGQGEPYRLAKRLGCRCVIDHGAVRQVDV